ncbi:MAG: hypothetical protein HONBIEJF_01661 [Fimbriimonadaceae bacterium]|nr:hypothetical protein [Fimbriimonadaceae bacterium]
MAERKAYVLRLAPELYDELRRLAAREMRSVNGQIEFMLREGLRRRGFGGDEILPGDADQEDGS